MDTNQEKVSDNVGYEPKKEIQKKMSNLWSIGMAQQYEETYVFTEASGRHLHNA